MIDRKWTSFPWHAFLLSVVSPLYLYRTNITQIGLGSFLTISSVCLALFSALFFILIFRRLPAAKAGLVTALCAIYFFSYGAVFTAWYTYITDPIAPLLPVTQREEFIYYSRGISHFLLLPSLTVGLFFLCRRIAKSSRSLAPWNTALNIAAVFLVISNLMPIVIDAASRKPADRTTDMGAVAVDTPKETINPSAYPDIYYIILDGACRQDTFEHYYRVPNTGLNSRLESLGFYVGKKSMSNYSETILSLSSSLNMMHHGDGSAKPLIDGIRDDREYYDLIRDNAVLKHLKSKGYLTIHLGSIWVGTIYNQFADKNIIYRKGFFRDELMRVFFSTTVFRSIQSWMSRDIADCHLFNFKSLTQIPDMQSPKFVFAHFVLPHSPYVFNLKGRTDNHVSNQAIWHSEKNQYQNPEAYREQWLATMSMTQAAVAQILAKSKTPPIIIIQADHGINLITNGPDKVFVRHAILNAYHFPGQDYKELYPSITPVNTFRVIFNKYFGEKYDLLEDKIIYTL